MIVQKIMLTNKFAFKSHFDPEYEDDLPQKKPVKKTEITTHNMLDSYQGSFEPWLNSIPNQKKYCPIKIDIHSDDIAYYSTTKGRKLLKNTEVLNFEKSEEGRKILDNFKKSMVSPSEKRYFTLVRKAAKEELLKTAQHII